MESKENLKVIHFAHWSRSGIISLIKTIIAEHGNSFGFVLLEEDKDFDNFYSGIQKKIQLKFSKSVYRAIRGFISFVNTEKPDIIHVHSLTPLLIATIFTPSYKKIFHLHCDYPYLVKPDWKSTLKRKILLKCIERKNCSVVTVSETSKRTLQGLSNVKVTYIANGIPDEGLVRDSFLDRQCANRFYSVCRLDKEKNITRAVGLISTLIVSGHDVYYDIYGSGSEYDNIEAYINKVGAQARIKMKGFSNTPENLPHEYDFYISTSEQEGLSLSALHALRGKTPLITTPVGQIGLVIDDRKNGFLLPSKIGDDSQKLIEIISFPPEKLHQIQTDGEQLYSSDYTTKKFLSAISRLYRTLP